MLISLTYANNNAEELYTPFTDAVTQAQPTLSIVC